MGTGEYEQEIQRTIHEMMAVDQSFAVFHEQRDITGIWLAVEAKDLLYHLGVMQSARLIDPPERKSAEEREAAEEKLLAMIGKYKTLSASAIELVNHRLRYGRFSPN
mgnify:CR=1 FL=1